MQVALPLGPNSRPWTRGEKQDSRLPPLLQAGKPVAKPPRRAWTPTQSCLTPSALSP